jgi:chromosome segregation ATPase
MAWKREKSNNEELRQERQRLTEELTATKGRTVALETDLMLLKGKHEVMERLVEAKDFEISQWKKRVNDLKEQHDEEEKSWEKSLKDGVARLNETDLQYDLAQDQITTLEKRLCENEQK